MYQWNYIFSQQIVPIDLLGLLFTEKTKKRGKVIVDATKGIYAIDEKNSIQLEGYFIKDKFFSRFEVMGSLLLTTEQLVDEELIFEIIVGSMTPVSVTGNEVINGDTIPPVQAFPVKVMQRAILRRQ